ncbi:MAG: HDIG domain-containing protein [Paludibacteraceae bacterium]|nr:HDIG domain-containing protein [Paludibacteraceae bacterium]
MVDYLAIIDKYYFESPELKNILIVHSRQVSDRALLLASRHPELNIDLQFVEEASMLHDIGIIYCNAPKIYCFGTHQYIEHGVLGGELLRREGLPRHAEVAERHTGSGITIEQIIREELPLPEKDYCPQTVEEKLICYADKFFSKSHIGEEVAYDKIRYNIWKYGHDAVLRFDQMREMFE